MRQDQIHYPWIVTRGGGDGYVTLLIVKFLELGFVILVHKCLREAHHDP